MSSFPFYVIYQIPTVFMLSTIFCILLLTKRNSFQGAFFKFYASNAICEVIYTIGSDGIRFESDVVEFGSTAPFSLLFFAYITHHTHKAIAFGSLLIAINRYTALRFPLLYEQIWTRKTVCILLLVCHVFSCLTSALPFFTSPRFITTENGELLYMGLQPEMQIPMQWIHLTVIVIVSGLGVPFPILALWQLYKRKLSRSKETSLVVISIVIYVFFTRRIFGPSLVGLCSFSAIQPSENTVNSCCKREEETAQLYQLMLLRQNSHNDFMTFPPGNCPTINKAIKQLILKVVPEMILLNSLECSQCSGRCYPSFGEGREPVLGQACFYCPRIFCGNCSQSGINGQCSGQLPQQYHNAPVKTCVPLYKVRASSQRFGILHYTALAYFDKYAPREEMRLLSLHRWSPLYCRTCSSTKRVGIGGYVFCPYCAPFPCSPADYAQMGCSPETKIIGELNELLTNDGRKAVQLKTIQIPRQVCSVCGDPVKDRNVTDSGRITCAYCCGSNPSYNIWNIECAHYFDIFLKYIPDVDDLKQLTYSKWTPLKCDKCSVVFSEIEENLPMLDKKQFKIVCQKCSEEENESDNRQNFITLHVLVDVIKEFRGYFKDQGIDCASKEKLEAEIPLSTLNENYLEDQLLEVSSLITKLKTTIPDTPRCQCGRYDEVTEMKNCSTCNINALCAKCTIKDHWGHQITDTMPELIVEVVNSESEKIERKLRSWRVRLEQTNIKGKETFGTLVKAYEALFLKALETMTMNYRTFEKIVAFCEKLKGAHGMAGKQGSSADSDGSFRDEHHAKQKSQHRAKKSLKT